MRGPRMYGPSKIRYQPGAVQRLFQMRKELPGRRHQREMCIRDRGGSAYNHQPNVRRPPKLEEPWNLRGICRKMRQAGKRIYETGRQSDLDLRAVPMH